MYNILSDDEVTRLFTIFKDSQHEFFNTVVNTLPDLIYVLDLNSLAILYTSRQIAAELGYTSNQIEQLHNPLFDLMYEEDKKSFLDHLELVKSSRYRQVLSIEYRMIKANGNIAWFIDRNSVFTYNEKGIPVTKIGITLEITHQKEQDEKEHKLEKIIQQTEILASTGSWEYDGQTKEFSWSKGMYRLFHLPQGTNVSPVIYQQYCTRDDLPVAEKIVKSIVSQHAFEEVLHVQVNGLNRTLRIKAVPTDQSLHNKKIVGIDLDITESENKEHQLHLLNKQLQSHIREIRALHLDLQTLTKLTSSDYKQNFKNIYTLLELLMMHDAEKLGNHGKANIRRMQSLLQKLNLMTDDIISYLTISQDDLVLQEYPLKDCMDHVIKEMNERLANSNATLNIQVQGVIVTNLNLFMLLMQHLIGNAIKFHHSGPIEITIRSEYVSIDDGNFLSLTVQDNGPGFDAEDNEKIFELFYKKEQVKNNKGSGVGLAIARKILDMHQGMIHAESRTGEGARFICYFPIEK